jgi:hypothetical protein
MGGGGAFESRGTNLAALKDGPLQAVMQLRAAWRAWGRLPPLTSDAVADTEAMVREMTALCREMTALYLHSGEVERVPVG